MKDILSDTDEQTDSLKFKLLSRMSKEEKIKRFFNLCEMTRKLTIAGIMKRHPNCDDTELKNRLAAIVLGKDLTKKYYNWDPEIEGY